MIDFDVNKSHPFLIYIQKGVFFLSNRNMLRSTLLLTVSGIAAKTVDFIFRAFYSRQLGSEGMGIFSLCFAVHGLVLNLATGGLGVAVSKLVSEHYAAGRLAETKKTMRIALSVVGGLSIAAIILTCVLSQYIAENFLKEPRCRGSIICIAPSVMFMGISYCIKGYFYASRRVLVPASSEFLEQAVKISLISYLLTKMLPYGVEYGCMAVFMGISIGELSSCLYLCAFYTFSIRQIKCDGGRCKAVLPAILKVSVPIMTTSLAGSFLRMHENVIIVSSLKKSGFLQAEALSVYGGIHGMVMPLIVFPLTLLSSCFTLLVPEISRAYAMKNRLRLQTLVSRLYRFCALFGFLVLSVLMVFGEKLITLVYAAPEIAGYLKTLAVISPFMFIDSISCGILNGMGKQPRLLIFSMLDSCSRIALIYLLMPYFGINALVGIIIFSNLLTSVLTYKSVVGFSKIGVKSTGRVWRYIGAVGVTCFVAGSLCLKLSTAGQVICGVIITAIIYFVSSMVFGAAQKSDFWWALRRILF